MKSSNRGSISVFIILILLSIILFEFVLLDVGQSMMLNHQLDQLIESSLRSIHTKYDKSLSEYGLYGIVNLDEKKHELIKQMKSNDINNSNELFSKIMNINIEKLSSTSTLGDISVLQSQIIKEMQWRAPLEWSFVAIDKIKQSNPSESIEQARNIAELSTQFENKLNDYHKTYVELDRLLNELFKNNGLIDTYCDISMKSLNELEKEANYLDFIAKWNIYVVELKLKQVIFNQEIERLINMLNNLRNIHEELLEELENGKFSINPEALLISEGYFNRFKLETKEIQSIFSGMSSLINSIEHFVGFDFTNRKQELVDSAKMLKQASELIFVFHNSEFKRVNDNTNNRQLNQKASENQIFNTISKLKSIFNSCPNTWNQSESIGEKMKPNEIGVSALKNTENKFKAFEVFTNHFYISEFVLNKFNYRTFSESKENSFNNMHKLNNFEIEKVLYGFNTCEANQSFATSEIFLTRLAIRITEEIMNGTFRVTLSPWTSFIEIVAKASYLALEDTKKLVRGEDVIFSGKFESTIKLNYLDYLRIYLYAQKNTKDILLSMQEIIELNTGIRFHEVSTATHLVVTMKRSRQSFISKWGTNIGGAEAKFSY